MISRLTPRGSPLPQFAGLKKAMTGMRDEMVNNLAKLSEIDERKAGRKTLGPGESKTDRDE